MLEPLRAMAQEVDQRWSKVARVKEALPDIAAETWEMAAISFDPEALIRAAIEEVQWAPQHQEHLRYGQPALTVFCSRDLLVEVYLWEGAGGGIHDHPFTGIFCILEGIALHDIYDFEPQIPLDDHMNLGLLKRQTLEVLRPGSLRRFGAPIPLIHRILHVKDPGASMVVRTREGRITPQYNRFSLGGLREPTERTAQVSHIKAQLLRRLAQRNPDSAMNCLAEYLDSADPGSVYDALLKLCSTPLRDELWPFLESLSYPNLPSLRKSLTGFEVEIALYNELQKAEKGLPKIIAACLSFARSPEETLRILSEVTESKVPAILVQDWLLEEIGLEATASTRVVVDAAWRAQSLSELYTLLADRGYQNMETLETKFAKIFELVHAIPMIGWYRGLGV